MHKYLLSLSALALALLAGCGSGNDARADVPTHLDLLMSAPRGIDSVAFDGATTYLSLANSVTMPSSVLSTKGPVNAISTWTPVNMGGCAMHPVAEGEGVPRSARLTRAAGKTFLFQDAYTTAEASLCEWDAAAARFAVKDQALRYCVDPERRYCGQLNMSDLQAVGTRLYSNAGGAPNLLVSDDLGASWRALLGALEGMACYNQSFHIIGTRLLVGGECPLDEAYVAAYRLSADGKSLAAPDKLPIQVPELENRNLQLIASIAGTQRVFIGVEGGLLRSEDGGNSFKFVIKHAVDGKLSYPYVTRLVSPANRPDVVVIAGFDKITGKAYLAWSADRGDNWTDLSKMLPGGERTNNELTAQVTSLSEDAQGRLLLTMNEDYQVKGKLFLLTLGTKQ